MRSRLTCLALVLVAATTAVAANAPPRDGPAVNQQLLDNPRALPRDVRPGELVHKPFVEPITAAKIQAGIDDAIMYLRSMQRPDGSIWAGNSATGETALAALAMLAAGADPASDVQLRKALDWLAKQNDNNTYIRGIRANTWEYALRKIPYDKGIKEALKGDFDWLMKALGSKEGWRYQMESTDWDNSVTQYGVLGTWAAARAGFDPGDDFWKKMSKHFRGCQGADGGWSYTTGGGTPNMATAGLASMFLVFDMYHGKGFYTAKNPRTFTEGEAAECLKSIARGMEWLSKNRGGRESAYYLYGIERTGVASGRKYIGAEDWFRDGALTILKRQQPDGQIPMDYGHVLSTSWCVLFLVYGGAPVALNKLEYGDAQDWNLNPRDLANVSKHLWSAYERPLNWHSVSIKAAAGEFEAPILFISGSKAAKFAEEDTLKLREYIERGGTILAEPSDGSKEFADSMAELVRQMFPENIYPSCKLAPLPPDHGVYTVMRQDWKKRPELLGVSDGARTCFFLSTEYMSADWQMDKTDSDAFKLAMNLLFYATDLSTLEGKFASILPDAPPAKAKTTVATVARIRHAGTKDWPNDWACGARNWQRFAPYLAHISGCKLDEKPAVKLGAGDLNPAAVRLLHLTGERALQLSEPERAALKKYVESGGTVLVDAYAGSQEFARSARRELESLFGKFEPLASDSILGSGRFDGGADLSRGIRYKLPARRLLHEAGKSAQGQALEVVSVKGRPAVIFSAFDLTAAVAGIENYRAAGYKPESARKVVSNLLAYIMVD